MFLNDIKNIFDIPWNDAGHHLRRRPPRRGGRALDLLLPRRPTSRSFRTLVRRLGESEAARLVSSSRSPLVLPAHEAVLKCSHLFNVLDAGARCRSPSARRSSSGSGRWPARWPTPTSRSARPRASALVRRDERPASHRDRLRGDPRAHDRRRGGRSAHRACSPSSIMRACRTARPRRGRDEAPRGSRRVRSLPGSTARRDRSWGLRPRRRSAQTVSRPGRRLGSRRNRGSMPSRAAAHRDGQGRLRRIPAQRARPVAGAGLGRNALPASVAAMSFPKTMRWGTGAHRWVRPGALGRRPPRRRRSSSPPSWARSPASLGRPPVPGTAPGHDRSRRPLRRGASQGACLVDPAERRSAPQRSAPGAAKSVGGTPSEDGNCSKSWSSSSSGRERSSASSTASSGAPARDPGHDLEAPLRSRSRFMAPMPSSRRSSRSPTRIEIPAGTSDAGNEWVVVGRSRMRVSSGRRIGNARCSRRRADLASVTFHKKLGSYADKRRLDRRSRGALRRRSSGCWRAIGVSCVEAARLAEERSRDRLGR